MRRGSHAWALFMSYNPIYNWITRMEIAYERRILEDAINHIQKYYMSYAKMQHVTIYNHMKCPLKYVAHMKS